MMRRIFLASMMLATSMAALAAAPGQEAPAATAPGEVVAEAKVGASTFREYCRSCHGPEGKGDGSVAKYLDPKPADLTRIRERNKGVFPADQVAAAIAGGKSVKGHGDSEMPIWGSAFREVRGGQTEEQVKQRIAYLVRFLESIQVETAPKDAKP